MEHVLFERGSHPYEAIVAGGDQAVDPHERGHGPLPANLPIILDIFPRDNATRYHGDMTRTVVRGRASMAATRMFLAVREAKARAGSLLKDGVDGKKVHEAVQKTFEKAKSKTGERGGPMVGSFHGTGHGLGLAVHEYPGLGRISDTIRAGDVVTVEPGLYYPGAGGVRPEDDVPVTNRCTAMAKEITAKIKLQVPAGKANPAPPVGPALGQHGVNFMEFCKAFNAQTQNKGDLILPVVITIYPDRSFSFIVKTPPASVLIKRAAGIIKGSAQPNRDKVGKVTLKQIREIAETKMPDLYAVDMEGAVKTIMGTARSMGIEVME